MADLLSLLSIISFAAAGVCLVLAIFLWFFLRIPSVIGDLTGRTARKSIAKMRAANEKTGVKSYKASKTNAERGKLTGTIPGIGGKSELGPEPTHENIKPETGVLADNQAEGRKTETTGLLVDENATAPLDVPAPIPRPREAGKQMVMLDEVILIHTDEVIG